MAALTDLQLRFGGKEMYGDPREPLPLLRLAVLTRQGTNVYAYRLLASLNDEQWARLTGNGLTDADLAPDQVDLIWQYVGKMENSSSPRPKDMTVLFGLYKAAIPATTALHRYASMPDFGCYNLLHVETNTVLKPAFPGNAGGGGGPFIPREVKATVEVPQR